MKSFCSPCSRMPFMQTSRLALSTIGFHTFSSMPCAAQHGHLVHPPAHVPITAFKPTHLPALLALRPLPKCKHRAAPVAQHTAQHTSFSRNRRHTRYQAWCPMTTASYNGDSTSGAAPAANGHARSHAAAVQPSAASTMASPTAMFLNAIPPAVLSDSYKATHYQCYPEAHQMVAYGEFRSGFDKDTSDTRLVVYGLRYIMEHYVARQWTEEDVERADAFFSTYMAPTHGSHPFPKELFLKFVRENDGWFPVRVQALPEGTCVNARVPVYQLTTEGAYAPLCTWLETILTMMWYPSSVATLSRRARDLIEAAFEASVDGGAASPLLLSRLHDFGFRGCTCVEQSVIGGCAHLLNFDGSDTMSAAYYAQYALNQGRPVAMSIPASEHSVMTSWPTERAAIANLISHYGTGLFSCVMDSYDYAAALGKVLPSVASEQIAAGGYMVLRPDSGDPVEAVLMALHACEQVFGVNVNSKGYKVIRGAGVIQGDGINIKTLSKILHAVLEAGYSAESVAFGMGGGLLQKVNRDTMSFATKLSHIVLADGSSRDIMKAPATDMSKASLPGVLAVKRVKGVPTAFPAEAGLVAPEEDMLQVVYDCGPVPGFAWDSFDAVRARVAKEWGALPRTANMISAELAEKVVRCAAEHHVKGAASNGYHAVAAAPAGEF